MELEAHVRELKEEKSNTLAKIEDDAELWEKCVAGDENSWGILVDRYKRLVCRTILDALKDFSNPSGIDWKDIFQDVFLKLTQKLHQWKKKATLATYIRAIAYRATIDEIRKRKVDPPENDVPTKVVDPLNQLLVNELMKNLTPNEYLLTRLHFLEGWSLQEIADLLGKDVGAIHTMKSRALAKLRKFGSIHGSM